VVAVDDQLRLIEEELVSLRGVAEKGFVSKTRVRALERQKAELQGQRGQFAATVAQTGASRAKPGSRFWKRRIIIMTSCDRTSRCRNALADARPKWAAARDQLARIDIRAPVSGIVVGLTVFTRGGVIAPGRKLLDIVPTARR
jgi:HlyD family secretion protein